MRENVFIRSIALLLIPALLQEPALMAVTRVPCPVIRNGMLALAEHGPRCTVHNQFASQALAAADIPFPLLSKPTYQGRPFLNRLLSVRSSSDWTLAANGGAAPAEVLRIAGIARQSYGADMLEKARQRNNPELMKFIVTQCVPVWEWPYFKPILSAVGEALGRRSFLSLFFWELPARIRESRVKFLEAHGREVLVNGQWTTTQEGHLRQLADLHRSIVLTMLLAFVAALLTFQRWEEALRLAEAAAIRVHQEWNIRYFDHPVIPTGTGVTPPTFSDIPQAIFNAFMNQVPKMNRTVERFRQFLEEYLANYHQYQIGHFSPDLERWFTAEGKLGSGADIVVHKPEENDVTEKNELVPIFRGLRARELIERGDRVRLVGFSSQQRAVASPQRATAAHAPPSLPSAQATSRKTVEPLTEADIMALSVLLSDRTIRFWGRRQNRKQFNFNSVLARLQNYGALHPDLQPAAELTAHILQGNAQQAAQRTYWLQEPDPDAVNVDNLTEVLRDLGREDWARQYTEAMIEIKGSSQFPPRPIPSPVTPRVEAAVNTSPALPNKDIVEELPLSEVKLVPPNISMLPPPPAPHEVESISGLYDPAQVGMEDDDLLRFLFASESSGRLSLAALLSGRFAEQTAMALYEPLYQTMAGRTTPFTSFLEIYRALLDGGLDELKAKRVITLLRVALMNALPRLDKPIVAWASNQKIPGAPVVDSDTGLPRRQRLKGYQPTQETKHDRTVWTDRLGPVLVLSFEHFDPILEGYQSVIVQSPGGRRYRLYPNFDELVGWKGKPVVRDDRTHTQIINLTGDWRRASLKEEDATASPVTNKHMRTRVLKWRALRNKYPELFENRIPLPDQSGWRLQNELQSGPQAALTYRYQADPKNLEIEDVFMGLPQEESKELCDALVIEVLVAHSKETTSGSLPRADTLILRVPRQYLTWARTFGARTVNILKLKTSGHPEGNIYLLEGSIQWDPFLLAVKESEPPQKNELLEKKPAGFIRDSFAGRLYDFGEYRHWEWLKILALRVVAPIADRHLWRPILEDAALLLQEMLAEPETTMDLSKDFEELFETFWKELLSRFPAHEKNFTDIHGRQVLMNGIWAGMSDSRRQALALAFRDEVGKPAVRYLVQKILENGTLDFDLWLAKQGALGVCILAHSRLNKIGYTVPGYPDERVALMARTSTKPHRAAVPREPRLRWAA